MTTTIYHVTIPAIALVRAEDAEAAEAIAWRALEAAGFTPYEYGQGDGAISVFESEPIPSEHEFAPHRCSYQRTIYTGD